MLVLVVVGVFVFYSRGGHADSESYLYRLSSVKEEAPDSNNPVEHIRDVFQEPVTITEENTTLNNNNQIYAITEILNSPPALPVKTKQSQSFEKPLTESPLMSSLENMDADKVDEHFNFIEGHRNDALPIPQKSRQAEVGLTNPANQSKKIHEESRSALIFDLSPEQINVLNLLDSYTQVEKPFNFSRDLIMRNIANYEGSAKANSEGDAVMIFLQIAVIVFIFLQELLFLCARLSLMHPGSKNSEQS